MGEAGLSHAQLNIQLLILIRSLQEKRNVGLRRLKGGGAALEGAQGASLGSRGRGDLRPGWDSFSLGEGRV